MLFSTLIENQHQAFTMNLLRWRINGPRNFARHRLWSPMKRIPQMSMGILLFTYHVNHAQSMQLQSQACLVHRAHMRTTTNLRSSFAKSLEGWLYMYMFIVNIADFVGALWHQPCS